MDTLTVPRIVPRALRGTSGITLLMGDGDALGCFRTSDSTDFASTDLVSAVSAAGFGLGSSLTTGAASLGAGWVLNTLMPTQLSSTTATAPGISSSAPRLKRRRTGPRGGPFELISMRITSEAGRSAAGSGIADGRRSVPGPLTGETSASRRRCLRSISGNRTNEVYQGSPFGTPTRSRAGYDLAPRPLSRIDPAIRARVGIAIDEDSAGVLGTIGLASVNRVRA